MYFLYNRGIALRAYPLLVHYIDRCVMITQIAVSTKYHCRYKRHIVIYGFKHLSTTNGHFVDKCKIVNEIKNAFLNINRRVPTSCDWWVFLVGLVVFLFFVANAIEICLI